MQLGILRVCLSGSVLFSLMVKPWLNSNTIVNILLKIFKLKRMKRK